MHHGECLHPWASVTASGRRMIGRLTPPAPGIYDPTLQLAKCHAHYFDEKTRCWKLQESSQWYQLSTEVLRVLSPLRT